jgi:hypothetical protein
MATHERTSIQETDTGLLERFGSFWQLLAAFGRSQQKKIWHLVKAQPLILSDISNCVKSKRDSAVSFQN